MVVLNRMRGSLAPQPGLQPARVFARMDFVLLEFGWERVRARLSLVLPLRVVLVCPSVEVGPSRP